MIKWKQSNMGFDNFGLDYGNPDFVKYIESYGGKGWRVSAADQVAPQIKQCLAQPGVHLIDIPIDYSLNDKTLNKTIRELSAKL
jgi:acetolactate synthase-1/2/3 large subunit